MFAGARQTAAVAVFAVVAGVLSGGYNDNYGHDDYFVRLLVVIAGAAFAVRGRALAPAPRRRPAPLRAAARRGADRRHRGRDPRGRRPRRRAARPGLRRHLRDRRRCAAARSSGSGSSRTAPTRRGVEERLRARGPWTVEAIRAGRPLLVAHVDEAHLRRNARGEEDFEFLRSLRERSHINVPLRSRGRNVGTLALLATSHPYGESDLRARRSCSPGASASRSTTPACSPSWRRCRAGSRPRWTRWPRRSRSRTRAAASSTPTRPRRPRSASRRRRSCSPRRRARSPARSTPSTRTARRCDLEELPARRVLAGRTPEPVLVRAVNRTTRRGALADGQGDAGAGARGRAAAGRDRDRGRHRGQARGARRALPGPGRARCWPPRWTTSRRWPRSPSSRSRGSRTGAASRCPDGDRLRPVAVAHVDPAKVAFARAYQERYPTALDAPTGAAQVLRDGVLAAAQRHRRRRCSSRRRRPGAARALDELGMRAAMVVPMVAGGRVIGVHQLRRPRSPGAPSRQADLELAEELGRRAGTAVENARLYAERSHIAATLQRGLLPDELPAIEGLRLASLYRPAGEENLVGGDFYDAFPTPVGLDAAGRRRDRARRGGRGADRPGAPHAAHRGHAARRPGRGARAAQPRARAADGADAVHGRARARRPGPRDGDVRCAGHPQPLLVRDGEPRAVGHFGPMLGAWTDSRWRAEEIALRSGDVLVLYSDGVTDTVGATGASARSACWRRCAASATPTGRSRRSTPR